MRLEASSPTHHLSLSLNAGVGLYHYEHRKLLMIGCTLVYFSISASLPLKACQCHLKLQENVACQSNASSQ
jgi:hypothetical protein